MTRNTGTPVKKNYVSYNHNSGITLGRLGILYYAGGEYRITRNCSSSETLADLPRLQYRNNQRYRA